MKAGGAEDGSKVSHAPVEGQQTRPFGAQLGQVQVIVPVSIRSLCIILRDSGLPSTRQGGYRPNQLPGTTGRLAVSKLCPNM